MLNIYGICVDLSAKLDLYFTIANVQTAAGCWCECINASACSTSTVFALISLQS